MKFLKKYILLNGLILLITGGIYGLNNHWSASHIEFKETENFPEESQTVTANDTATLFPVAKIVPDNLQDIIQQLIINGKQIPKPPYPIDLKTPDIFNDGFQYNPLTNRYELRSKIGDDDIVTPISLTPEEYYKYSLEKSMNEYYKNKYSEELQKRDSTAKKDVLSIFDFKFDLGPADKIFGPGGVQLKADGNIQTKMGFIRTSTANPTLTERQRNRTAFDFDAQIKANIDASVGNKLNYNMSYNTEPTTFDFDQKKLKLGYVGKEDEIVKVLEAGNVSMNTTNSLIRGGASLFGVKTELQFGKFSISAIFSQQETQSRTTSSRGNTQTTPFEITVDNYDENLHYFLGHYFFDSYDDAMTTLPYIKSGINIDRLEVWITNKRANFNEARNIVAFADLGEHEHIFNTDFTHPAGTDILPSNKANDLYTTLIEKYPEARNISQINQAFENTSLEGGNDYVKIESARKLELSDYTLHPQLGYISLRYPLNSDEILAVAFSYTYKGNSYQVGEFSTDNPTNTNFNLFVKLIKGTTVSPASSTWRLMMKNVYTITDRLQSLDKEKFRLNIKYQNDTTGVFLNYITEGDIANKLLLRVMNLDRLDSRNEPHPDGFFDFIEGLTVISNAGKIIFPVVEPFGSHLRKQIGNDVIADKYVFQELYDSTLTVARQTAEKNKFILQGEYKGSGGTSINLEANNIARGSVIVTANGVRLQENKDYTVNYGTGHVTITNPAYENAKIETSSENKGNSFGMQRKTMMGMNLNYAINPKFNIGATFMNLSEMPLTMKTAPGTESINNTLFGFNVNYAGQSQSLTNLLDKLPFLELTAPSQITFKAEYAQLIPGHYKSKYGGDYAYIDDFEDAKRKIELRTPYSWVLASTPSSFPESRYANDIRYGFNRSLLAWYYIDVMFTRKSSLTPTHIKNDLNQLSNHYVREILETELFPNKDRGYQEPAAIPVLNLAYYPKERGPYNLNSDGMNDQGLLNNPEKRWGGVMRRIESGNTDFELNNYETIEFWVLDPFIYNPNSQGGDLYFNLGEISEDILKDEKKFFENGLPIDKDSTKVEKTVWGLVPKQQSTVYAFDNAKGSRKTQDVGLNGLSTEDEMNYPTYANYLQALINKLPAETIQMMRADQFSPFNDPAGDNYHYFRGSDYDRAEMPILGRYKRFNGTEGNSIDMEDSNENYNTATRLTPDVEDINQDNTLNETEKYFEYKISIRPQDMEVGKNHIVQKLEVAPALKNGSRETVTWYQFKIPIREFDNSIGGLRDFKTIRFMRMYLTNFTDSVILRFGTLEIVGGYWRVYTKDLSDPNRPPLNNANISLSVVNIEESGEKEPVNYIMPPGVNRIMDPSQPQLRQQNEQSLAVQITDLAPGDARAIYKSVALDTRQYRRIQMFSHAESLIEKPEVRDNDLYIFMRLGSDYKNNYYEYEIPLKITPPRRYSELNTDRQIVWPESNMFDFPFELLTNLKLERNKEKRAANSEVTFYTPYSSFDPEKPANKITVVGNPSISDLKVIMIGVRNHSRNTISTEVWCNELRLTEFNEDGGWAGNANLFVGLSNLGSFNFAGRMETAGFGSLDQGIMERNIDDKFQYSVSTQLDLGLLFPEKIKLSVPFSYSYQEEVISPKYNPLDQDVLLSEALKTIESKADKDSIRSIAQNKISTKTIDFNNIKVDIRSKIPMPYDPANFGFNYSFMENNLQNATTEYDRNIRNRFNTNYVYSSPIKPWQPFGSASGNTNTNATKKFLQGIEIGYLPTSITINSDILRDYYEFQFRDLNDSGDNRIPASFREDFFWNRSTSLQWNLTKNLKLDFNSGTNARIESPYVQVNKQLNPNDYTLWKDSVWQSIKDLGRPMDYKQTFVANYLVPFQNIPALNFIKATLNFNSYYTWQRGAVLADPSIKLGNTINSNRKFEINDFSFNLLSLYNKSKFLNDANNKFMPKRQTASATNNRASARPQNQPAAQSKKNFESQITLNLDSGTIVKHQLNNKRLRVTARNTNGKLYELKYKAIDNNSIQINNKDTVILRLSISLLPPLEENKLYQVSQYVARGLMMVRSVGFSYSQSSDMMLPYFTPEIGNFFGQGSTPLGNSPGLDFAFGLAGKDYIEKANRRGWLIKNEENITPAMISKMETFKYTATIEPVVGMRITLNADRMQATRNQYYFMFENKMPPKITGDFKMTMISIGSAFESTNASKGYYSKSFETFLKNRNIIERRLDQVYRNVTYPNSGFLANTEFAGKPYDPSNGALDLNSVDVLIPAFISAYSNSNPRTVGLTAFPSLLKLLPNWMLNYEGLMQLPIIKKHFRTFVIEHKYSSLYSVGAFNSFLNWVTANGTEGIGFSQNVMFNNPFPSSPYDITVVSINEVFSPLIGINSTLLNNVNLKLQYNKSRNINLNISSYQITEMQKNDFTFGTGYRFDNFNRVLKIKKTGGANFNNELKVDVAVSYNKTLSLIRKIEDSNTQAVTGDAQTIIKFAADYSMSKMITLIAYFDKQISNPLVSSAAYPLTKTSFGISVKVNFTR